jgi:hypothetical protein
LSTRCWQSGNTGLRIAVAGLNLRAGGLVRGE